MNIELRNNQVEPVRKGVEFFRSINPVPSIIVAPTAFGKAHLIAHITHEIDDKVIALAPSKELLMQNYSKFTALGKLATIYSASLGQKQISPITFCTIGSIYKLGALFKKFGFTKLIIDECDRYSRESSGQLQTFIRDCGITHTLGLTATCLKLQTNLDYKTNTPYSKLVMLTSMSKKGNFFKEIIHVEQISSMVEGGYWSKLIYEQPGIDTSALRYNSSKSEYTEESMNTVYSVNKLHDKIISKILNLPERKSILVFVPRVAEAIELASKTPNAVAVYGDMDKKERDRAIEGFKDGRIRVVYNVSVLGVGFDHVKLDTIICARPTSSVSLYYQFLGRGTRIHPDKKDCLIVDFSGNVKTFGRIEHLRYAKGAIWKLYGEGDKLLTGVRLDSIHKVEHVTAPVSNTPHVSGTLPFGKFRNIPLSDVPKEYKSWMLQNFTWTEQNMNLKTLLTNSL